MADNTFPNGLDELQRQFRTLQQIVREDPSQVRERVPKVLAGLQRSLDGLRTIAAEPPPEAQASSNAATEPSRAARPSRGLRFREMAERGPVLVRIMSSETRCRWVNRAWLEFTGRNRKQLIGEGWLHSVHPEDRARCSRASHEAVDSSRLDRVEYRLRRPDGEYAWVLEIGTPRLTAHGRISGYLGTAIEIEEHKKAETHLALQNAVARVLTEAKTLEEASDPILRILCETLGWDVGELWSVDPKNGVPQCTRIWASSSVDASGLQEGLRTRVFPGGAGPAWQSGQPSWIADIAVDPTLGHEPEAERVGLHGMFRLPITVQGEVRAILRVFCLRVRQESESVSELMMSVGAQIGQILERTWSAERIRESEARKAAILEASLDAVITIDQKGKVVEFNSAAEDLFGYPREAAIGSDLLGLIVPPGMRERALAGFLRYQATGESGLLGKRLEASAMKSDGSEFPVEVAAAPIGTGNPPELTLYLCDATARKEAEREVRNYQERLRALMADLLLAEEHERRTLAVDLHDGLSQTIALTQLKLSALRASMDGQHAKALDELDRLNAQADQAARSISFELSPPILHDLGLAPAMQWLVRNIQTRYGIEVVLEDDGLPKPADEKTRVILFRSIRELLINAAKHARARRVHVRLQLDRDQVNAAIEDDGVGMKLDAAALAGSGLLSVRERLSHVGGSMRIESAPGKGTKIRLCAPLSNGRPTQRRMEA